MTRLKSPRWDAIIAFDYFWFGRGVICAAYTEASHDPANGHNAMEVRMKRSKVLIGAAIALMGMPSVVSAQSFPVHNSVAWGMSISAGNAILSNNTLRAAARASARKVDGQGPLFKRSANSAVDTTFHPARSSAGLDTLAVCLPGCLAKPRSS